MSSAAKARDRELAYLSAVELGQAYRSKGLSPVEVTQAALRRIEATQSTINAFVLFDPESALLAARAAELRFQRQAPLSPLDGVPLSLKDLLLTRGWPTRRGSRTVPAEGAWLEDSPAAARLREAGAVLLGKTTTSEFGLRGMGDSPLTGITRNPYNLEHTPGGSSAGAAAAVAAGLGTLAVGTDGGGSIRVPAAYSGVVGLKPTFGRVPSHPASVIGAPPHVGPIARSVGDARLLLEVLSQPDDRDPYRVPTSASSFVEPGLPFAQRRVGYLAGIEQGCGREARDAFEAVLSRCRELGCSPVPVELSFEGAADVLTTLFQARAAHTLATLPAELRSLVDPTIRGAAEAGEQLSLLQYLAVEAERTALALRVAHVFRTVDVLLTPTTAESAPTVDASPSPRRAPFTGLFSLTRHPAISIPSGTTRAGLPIGLQIVGRHFEEGLVLSVAAALESTRAFAAPPEL
ncbi:MAG: amidase [Myxococcales bacterium]|nr:MAG: amidase [Myxococcales bacterium]